MSADIEKLETLQCTFPKLTEMDQHYILGFAEGLKQAQNGKPAKQPKAEKPGSGKQKQKK